MGFEWNPNLEAKALHLKVNENKTYQAIADELGTTLSSAKHKIRRLQQKSNLDKYKHTFEKSTQLLPFLKNQSDLNILETHAGFGAMTEFYSLFGQVTSLELKQERVEAINALGIKQVRAVKCDSEHEVFRLIYAKEKFDVIDVDPYGYPSRLFPHIFKLIDDGHVVITLPMIGVAQMNKLTIAHLKVFWGVDYRNKSQYIDRFIARLTDYAFMNKHKLTPVSVERFDRIYRLVFKTKRTSLNDIVGLKVNR